MDLGADDGGVALARDRLPAQRELVVRTVALALPEVGDRRQPVMALVVGTGFGGLYSLYLLKQQGLDVIALESGSDVGGTWHWNT